MCWEFATIVVSPTGTAMRSPVMRGFASLQMKNSSGDFIAGRTYAGLGRGACGTSGAITAEFCHTGSQTIGERTGVTTGTSARREEPRDRGFRIPVWPEMVSDPFSFNDI